jgi:hypothetical protein
MSADKKSPEDRLTHLTMERHTNGRWSMVLRQGVLGPALYEARQMKSLDDCLLELAAWRKGVITA